VRFEAVLRSGIAAVTIAGVGAAFLILGVAAVSWRTQCAAQPGAGICFGMPAEEAVTPDPSAGIPEPVATPATEVVAAAEFKAPVTDPVVAEPVADESAPVLVAATSAPAATPEPVVPESAPDQLAEVAEMMASTFESLSAMKAAVNAAAVTGGPVQLPGTDLAKETTALAADVAAADPVPEVVAPKPVAVAMAAPAAAPTKRTVKIIPITTSVMTSSAAATAAAIAAAPPGTTNPQQVAAIEPKAIVDALAFADPSAGVPRASRTMKVNDNLVNVRSGPSTESERLLVLKRGDEVRALAVAGDWVEVEVSEGRTGWMLSKFLTDADLTGLPEREAPVETAAAPVAEPAITEPEPELVAEVESSEPTTLSGDVRTVLGAGVNVRSSPSSSAEKLFALPGGRKVSVSETQRGWLKVTDENGRSGWLYENYVSGS
jgi:uncharacterized protein YgiM (DUF1202 family)